MNQEEHEITIEVTTDMNNLIKILEKNGFKKDCVFIVKDKYMLPKNIDINIKSKDIKEILNESIRIREYNYFEKNIKRSELIKKIKKYDKKGNILKEKVFNCIVLDKNDAFKFIKSLGYKEILNINQKVTDYKKDKESIVVCEIDDKIYVEISNKDINDGNIIYNSIEEMINVVKKYKIPHDETNYFKQKAIDKLKKINKKRKI